MCCRSIALAVSKPARRCYNRATCIRQKSLLGGSSSTFRESGDKEAPREFQTGGAITNLDKMNAFQIGVLFSCELSQPVTQEAAPSV